MYSLQPVKFPILKGSLMMFLYHSRDSLRHSHFHYPERIITVLATHIHAFLEVLVFSEDEKRLPK